MTPAMRAYIDANQPCTALQIAEALGVTRQCVYEQTKHMRIVGWQREVTGHSAALYILGGGKPAIKPATMSQVVRSKAYWDRHRALIKARRPSKRSLALGPWSGLVGRSTS